MRLFIKRGLRTFLLRVFQPKRKLDSLIVLIIPTWTLNYPTWLRWVHRFHKTPQKPAEHHDQKVGQLDCPDNPDLDPELPDAAQMGSPVSQDATKASWTSQSATKATP
jgi:hypothetical protein